MKKIIYLLVAFTMVFFTSCNPLEDIYEDIDEADAIAAAAEPEDEIIDTEYTLIDEDYEVLDLSFGSFNSEEEVKSLLPDFLTSKYVGFGSTFNEDGSINEISSILVTYNLYLGAVEGISDYTEADRYELETSEYPSAFENAIAFYETEEASEYITDILTANFTDAEEGDVVLTAYNQYEGETVNGISEFYTADFQTEGTLLDFETVSVIGDQAWEETQSFGAKMSGYSGGSNENEDWLVSKEIDLANYPNATLQVNQILNFAAYDYVDVLISTDYSGDVDTTTWDVIDLTNVPDGSGWDEYLSEEYSLSAYNDKTVRIAFKYTSTDSAAGTWEILQVMLRAAGVEGDTTYNEFYYTYTGYEWELSSDVYHLSNDDFDLMGEASGQPGEYNNFSDSVSPDNYLPVFLNNKYPYAQESDKIFVVYKYYSGSLELRGNQYTYNSGVWSAYESVQEFSLQFGHDGTTWVPDNTIKYTLTQADYELVGNDYYGNFDVRAGSDEETEEVRLAKINTILLNNFPSDAEGQKYLVSYDIYDGSNDVWTLAVIKSGSEYILQE